MYEEHERLLKMNNTMKNTEDTYKRKKMIGTINKEDKMICNSEIRPQ